MRKAAVGVLLFLAGCEPTYVVSAVCDLPCYTGPEGTAGVGTCRKGRPRCDNGVVVVCEDEVTPQLEYCETGLDTNCDGALGIGLADTTIGALCGGGMGACGFGSINCVDGALVCLGERQPKEEDCSGRDLDCDGAPNNIKIELCYDGDLSNLAHPTTECRAGVFACVDGAKRCVGQQLPREEQCGAGLDQNCNGAIDDIDGVDPKPVDVIVALDRSGSMDIYYPAILPALKKVAADLDDSWRVRFTLVEFPYSEGDYAVLATNATPEEFRSTVDEIAGFKGSFETSYNVLFDIETEVIDYQPRTDAARVIWMFGDEQAQAYPYDQLESFKTRLIALFGARNMHLYVFTLPEHYEDYVEMAAVSGGAVYSIAQHSVAMTDLLEATLQSCE